MRDKSGNLSIDLKIGLRGKVACILSGEAGLLYPHWLPGTLTSEQVKGLGLSALLKRKYHKSV